MIQRRYGCGIFVILVLATTSKGQLLNGDVNFPILNEVSWNSKFSEVRSLCERRQLRENSTDSAIVINEPMLGFATRTELRFDQNLKTLKLVQSKFLQPTRTLVDSLTSYLTRTIARDPLRTVKEKSVLFMTLRMEIASWRLATGLVNLVTAMRGDSLFDVSLVLIPPATQQKSMGPQ